MLAGLSILPRFPSLRGLSGPVTLVAPTLARCVNEGKRHCRRNGTSGVHHSFRSRFELSGRLCDRLVQRGLIERVPMEGGACRIAGFPCGFSSATNCQPSPGFVGEKSFWKRIQNRFSFSVILLNTNTV